MAVFSASIIASGDDGLWIPSLNNFQGTFTELLVGKPAGAGNASTHFFVRVDNVTIEQGDTIDSALWDFIAAANVSDVTVNATIACVDADDASAPTTSAGAEALTLTSATVAWNNVEAMTSGTGYSPPDVAAPVQEVINRPGWVSGNALVFVFRDNGSTATGNANRSFASFDHTTLAAPALTIDYTPAVSTVDLSGTIAATSGATADLTTQAALSGTAAATAATTSDLTATAALAGTSFAVAAASADLVVVDRLSGTAAATASASADLSASAVLAGTVAAVATASANLTAGALEEDLLDGLISYWELEEASGTRFDSHGANDLTDVNTVTQDTGIIGNAAAYVSANGEQLTAASNADLQFGDRDWTVSCWFFATDSGTHAHIAKGDPSTANFKELTLQQAVFDRLQMTVYDASGSTSVASLSTGINAFSLDTWNHVVAWHDDTANEVGFILNGGTPVTATPSGALGAGDSLLYVGHGTDGRLDEVGKWNRVLTTDERDALWNDGAGLAYSEFTESGPGALSGTASAQSSASAALTTTASLSGTAAAQSAASAALTVGEALSGTAAASSSLTGSLTTTAALSGTASASASATAALTLKHNITGTISATASASGDITAQAALAGSVLAEAAAQGALSASAALSGTSAGAAAATADLRLFHTITGTAAASSSVSGGITATAHMTGTAAALAILTADLTGGDINLPGRAILLDARPHYILRDGRTHYRLRDGRAHYALASARSHHHLRDARPHYILRKA